mgnify:CR=1 FL=1
MRKLARFGVSIDHKLLKQFDALIKQEGYTNRSEALRDLIRAELVQGEWKDEEEVVGVIMAVFDHHQSALQEKVTDFQHQHIAEIITSLHVHLDHHNCLEVVIARGNAGKVRRLADGLKSIRGIKHCSLSMSTSGKSLV